MYYCITYAQLVSQVNIYNFDFSLYLNIDQLFNIKPPGGIQAWIREQNNTEYLTREIRMFVSFEINHILITKMSKFCVETRIET